MVKLLNVYTRSPIALQHIFTSAYGFKLKMERYNKLYRRELKKYRTDRVSQEQQLLELLIHLKENIDAYKSLNINRGNIYETFQSLPHITKEHLRNELKNRSYMSGKLREDRTSGTTGKNLIVYSSEHDRAKRMAYLDYIKLLHGVKPFSKRASFTGQQILSDNHKNIFWRYNIPINQILYASYIFNQQNLKYVYEQIAKQKPVTLDGFPSAIHMVAKYIIKQNIQVDWDVKAVFPTAETLAPHVKADIERAFHTRVVDQYASSEGAPFIYLDEHDEYVLARDTGIFEFHKVNGHIYDMVVTSFLNYATPIVRYTIGDQVEIKSEEEYLCSYTDDIQIERIIGRKTDVLIGSNNNKVSVVNISWIMAGFEAKVIQYQVIQKAKNKFLMNLVVEDDFNKTHDIAELRKRLNRKFGYGNDYEFVFLADIPREKSGKIRFIINEIGDTA